MSGSGDVLRIIPLGGLGEIGLNMMLLEYADSAIAIDCGVMFPEASMLGIDPASVKGEMADAIGELTNMIAGSFRTRMAGVRGETWGISIPTVTVGLDFRTMYMSDVQRVLCPITMGTAELFVELIVTQSAGR